MNRIKDTQRLKNRVIITNAIGGGFSLLILTVTDGDAEAVEFLVILKMEGTLLWINFCSIFPEKWMIARI